MNGLLYQGEDILVTMLKPFTIKICFPQPYFQIEDQNGELWLLSFDYSEDGVAVYRECHRSRHEMERRKIAAVFAGKNNEIATLKRKIEDLENVLKEGLNDLTQGATKLAKFAKTS